MEIADIRKVIFTPCETKEQLKKWVTFFLDMDLPDCVVSDKSNSTPFDFLWECYERCKNNDLEGFSRVMSYASRGGGKTLGASIFEILAVLHLKRNVIHMAAHRDQSAKALEYVKGFTNKKHIREFVVLDNTKESKLAWYTDNRNGNILSQKEFDALVASESDKAHFIRSEQYIRVIASTVRATNGQHGGVFICDEVDIVQDRNAYEEAKNIPTSEGDRLPVTILTSTRKSSYGHIQREIDEAPKSKLIIRHWNIIDVTKPCPTERHKPNEPRVDMMISDESLESITPDAHKLLDEKTAAKYEPINAFAGCAACPILASCKTRLATHQKSTSKILRPVVDTIAAFRSNTLKMAKTQLMCEQPDESGLIYPRFSREIHGKTAAEIVAMVTGDEVGPDLDKTQLIKFFIDRGFSFYSGMDFGFTHPFATVSIATNKYSAFVFDVLSMAGLELDEKIAVSEKLKLWNPKIFGDTEAPADIKTFRRRGFRMGDWKKYAGSVRAGIEIVRMKLKPTVGEPQLFFLLDDPQVEGLMVDIAKYHFKTDVYHNITDEPDDENDDALDALRYCIMNVFAPDGRLKIVQMGAPPVQEPDFVAPSQENYTASNYLDKLIADHSDGVDDDIVDTKPKRKGGFVWDMD